MLSGKVAIITGALGGIGQAQAKHYRALGAAVVEADLLKPEAQEPECGGFSVRFDVTDEENWQRVVAAVLEIHGHIDILVNNAGYFAPRRLMETTIEDMHLHHAVNQIGPFLSMKAVVPTMQAQGAGAIVNIGSSAGLRGSPGMFSYSGTKWALRGLTKCASSELAPLGIRVNSVHPGVIDTAMLTHNDPMALAALEAAVPLGSVVARRAMLPRPRPSWRRMLPGTLRGRSRSGWRDHCRLNKMRI